MDNLMFQSYEQLKKTLDNYVNTVVRVSDDIIRFKIQSKSAIKSKSTFILFNSFSNCH